MNDNRDMMVSVYMLTYKHENYIAQAIEGVMMQQTNFLYELVIGEDCSPDNTRRICLEYKEKYPDKIKLLLPEQNLGVKKNGENTLSACTGKYIACCEGDDFWTDPLKLQKQVDFLESHPDYTICGGMYQTIIEGETGIIDVDWLVKGMKKYPQGKTITLDNYFYPYLFWFLTVCIRRSCLEKLKEFENIRDDTFFAVALEQGKGFVFHELFAVYRQHAGGIWTGKSMKERLYGNLKFMTELNNNFKNKSWCIRHGFYATKMSVLFYDLKVRNKFGVITDMLKSIFSGKIQDFPYRISFFFRMLYAYANSFFRKMVGLPSRNIAVEPH